MHDKAPVGVPKSVVKAGASKDAPRAPGGSAQPTNRIVVSNLHYEIMPKDLVVSLFPLFKIPFNRDSEKERRSLIFLFVWFLLASLFSVTSARLYVSRTSKYGIQPTRHLWLLSTSSRHYLR